MKYSPTAILDIGTNTVILLIARRVPGGDIEVLHDIAEVVRLGEGINSEKRFREAAMDRTYDALSRFSRIIHDARCDAVFAVGTAAFRGAANASKFVERVQKGLGITIQIISGEAEAKYIALAAKADFSHLSRPLVVMDIGGGSTEFITDDGVHETAVSLPFGSVKLTEKFIKSDPPNDVELDALTQFLDAEMTHLACPAGNVHRIGQSISSSAINLVACAGTATTLAALHLGLEKYDPARVHKSILPRAGLENLLALLRSLPLEKRRSLPCLEPLRADVVVAGAQILLSAMEYYGVKECHISDRGLRFGVFLKEVLV